MPKNLFGYKNYTSIGSFGKSLSLQLQRMPTYVPNIMIFI